MESDSEYDQVSKFWLKVNDSNKKMLAEFGLKNFKRTVSNNYFNWIVTSPRDPIFVKTLRKLRFGEFIKLIKFRIAKDKITVSLLTAPNGITLTKYSKIIYKFFVGALWLRVAKLDKLGIVANSSIEEPRFGSRIELSLNGRFISQDLANSIYEANQIDLFKLQHKSIAEIGAGYGRLAWLLTESQDILDYFIFDISQTLELADFYLSNVCQRTLVYRIYDYGQIGKIRKDKPNDKIIWLCPSQIFQKFDENSFDVIISISTLPELSSESQKYYLERMPKLAKQMIYLRQWITWSNPDDVNSWDINHLDFGSDWKLSTYDDPYYPNFTNYVYSRSDIQLS